MLIYEALVTLSVTNCVNPVEESDEEVRLDSWITNIARYTATRELSKDRKVFKI